MCGIIGYIGKRQPTEVLINGLKQLEYRGYDSAGIALKNEEEVQIIKSVGKIANLEKKIENEKKNENEKKKKNEKEKKKMKMKKKK